MPVVGTVSGAKGSVVIRNSERSLTNPRSAMTATGRLDVKVNVPNAASPPLKGSSSRNRAICSRGPSVKVPCPESMPSLPVKKNATVAASSLGLAMARPVRTGPSVSAKIRPSRTAAAAGTPASETRIPFGREPNMASPAGGVIPSSGHHLSISDAERGFRVPGSHGKPAPVRDG